MTEKTQNDAGRTVAPDTAPARGAAAPVPAPEKPTEIGGPKGLDPVRYGDWERNGKCVDF